MRAEDIEINVSRITTCMGRSNDWTKVPGITDGVAEILNGIGYGDIRIQGSIEDYLNFLKIGYAYKVVKIKSDSGDFMEEFMVIAVREKVLENNKPLTK